MNAEGIVKRITRPEDCVLGFALPTTEEGFHARRKQALPGSFVADFSGTEEYRAKVIAPYRKLGGEVHRLGARLVPDLTLGRYASLFRDRRVHAVVLFAHWANDSVEFWDGPAGIDSVIEAVPEDFKVIIDLCVCHPGPLIPRLRDSRPLCPIPHLRGNTRATFITWLHFYRDLFRFLCSSPKPYLSASTELVAAYLGIPLEVAI